MASQTLRTLKLSLLADVSEFGKGMGKATSDFQKFSRNVESASRVATGVIGVIGGIAVSAISAASDLSETGSAIEQVFGPKSARELDAFARSAARGLGQSRQQALSAAQTFGIFGQAAGLGGDELVDFTTDLVTLATDLASFNNTSVDQAINALGAALRGETEPIRTYGILLDAATIKNRALADGIIETTNEALTPQQKTLATYNQILADTQTQQGDFGRTSEGLANSQRILEASFADFRVELGEQLLPVVQELLPKAKEFFDTIFDSDPEAIVELAVGIAQLATAVVALNTALKVFAALQGAAKFLFSTAGTLLVPLAAGGSAEVIPLAEQREIREAANQLALQGGAPTLPARPGRNPQTGLGRNAATQPIIVNGIVGSPYQVFREIERINSTGQRSASTFSGGNR